MVSRRQVEVEVVVVATAAAFRLQMAVASVGMVVEEALCIPPVHYLPHRRRWNSQPSIDDP